MTREKRTVSEAKHSDESEKPKDAEKPRTNAKPNTSLSKKEINITESPLDHQQLAYVDDKDELTDSPVKSELGLKLCDARKERAPNVQLLRNFKLLLDDLILSCSPFMNFVMPFLLTDNPMDKIRIYLPNNYVRIFLESKILQNDCQLTRPPSPGSCGPVSLGFEKATDKDNESLSSASDDNLHEFLLLHLTKSFDDEEIRKLYADYRSRGGIAALNVCRRLVLTNLDQMTLNELKSLETNENEEDDFPTYTKKTTTTTILSQVPVQTPQNAPKQTLRVLNDCLDVMSRQHIAVLFFSQNESSPVYPNICQKPRIIKMNFYSENDMTLGSFLARNCFRNGYKCNNELCDTLIIYHTRS